MTVSIMLDIIRDHGSRTQYLNACAYSAHGNAWGIRGIYDKVVGR